MGLFNFRRTKPTTALLAEQSADEGIPLLPIDQDKRYDVYCSSVGEERIYEDVRFVALRQFETVTQYSAGYGSFLEIKFADGARILIPSYCIQMLCEHGVEPKYRVLKKWGNK